MTHSFSHAAEPFAMSEHYPTDSGNDEVDHSDVISDEFHSEDATGHADASDQASAEQAVEQDRLEAMETPADERLPKGIRRHCRDGHEVIDAMAGRASVFGFGYDPITDAIHRAAADYLGDGSAFEAAETGEDDAGLQAALQDVIGQSCREVTESICLCPAADAAVEMAISWARRYRPQKAFRTVAIVGSDHGRTAMCRTASGRPELHEDLGPMMAGFSHVPLGDVDALQSAVDQQTACILLSPISWHDAARALDADYLVGIRRLCDERGILLVVDETQIAFGSSGSPLAISSIADVRADVVALSAGLFAGLPGGIAIASQRATGRAVVDTGRYPLLAAVAAATLRCMTTQQLPGSVTDLAQQFAVSLAERVRGFEFVRDVHVLGTTIGLETDIESEDIVQAARQRGLRLEAAGDTAIALQLPLVMSEDDRQSLLDRIGDTLLAMELQTRELGV